MKQSVLTKDKFILPSEIFSILIPFYSAKNDDEKLIPHDITDLKTKGFVVDDFTDESGAQYVFEEDPEEFFGIFNLPKAS